MLTIEASKCRHRQCVVNRRSLLLSFLLNQAVCSDEEGSELADLQRVLQRVVHSKKASARQKQAAIIQVDQPCNALHLFILEITKQWLQATAISSGWWMLLLPTFAHYSCLLKGHQTQQSSSFMLACQHYDCPCRARCITTPVVIQLKQIQHTILSHDVNSCASNMPLISVVLD